MTADGTEPRMTPLPPDTGPRRHPDVFDVADWQRHAGDLLDTWLEEEFTWAGRPLARFAVREGVSGGAAAGHRCEGPRVSRSMKMSTSSRIGRPASVG
jgi:hypothetical protein